MGRGDGLHRGGAVGPGQGLTHLFYDGGCGVCRGAVRFTAKRDRSRLIRFAPLGGETFERLVQSHLRAGLPDSIVILTPEGELLCRSGAVLHLLYRMGPMWHLVGILLSWIPVRLRDWSYDLLARWRPNGRACAAEAFLGDDRFES
jgi:predicted DCC family thiol-disulfide oxidoreductase YuxK